MWVCELLEEGREGEVGVASFVFVLSGLVLGLVLFIG